MFTSLRQYYLVQVLRVDDPVVVLSARCCPAPLESGEKGVQLFNINYSGVLWLNRCCPLTSSRLHSGFKHSPKPVYEFSQVLCLNVDVAGSRDFGD